MEEKLEKKDFFEENVCAILCAFVAENLQLKH